MDQIKIVKIEDQMKKSYVDYSMSVIVGRALPDVKDGLKPVHRRILFAMNDMGLVFNKTFKKSARIVGEVLGKYHPHGDTAVYDSMVRMAQDFSLRYPLVKGQGNFGCFTKDTKVALTNGVNLSFEELIKEYTEGKVHYTYTINKEGNIEIAEIKNPRLTKENQSLVKIILDNGGEIKCTLDHLFMLKTGEYKEAKDLVQGDSLMPLYFKKSSEEDNFKPALKDYNLIYQPNSEEWVPVHVLSDQYNLSNGIYAKSSGRVRHHKDFNKLNNDPINIIRMNWKAHWKLHAQHASNLHKKKDYRQKIAAGRKEFWDNEDNRKAYSHRMSKRNIENWKNDDYRKKMSQFLSDVNKKYIEDHPEKREEFSKRATLTLKRLWKDEKYRVLFNSKIVATNKKRITNNTGKVKFLKICKEVLENCKILNKKNYEKIRKELYSYGHATGWEKGLDKYFKGNSDLILNELNGNHKVVDVQILNVKEDVFDLTIDETHNFALASGVFVHNSVDGDRPAAMRYTEAKLAKLSSEMLKDIDKETVEFSDNFDGSLKEPIVLPSLLPNLLLNGSSGIAVGMATNMPPHNLSEVCDAVSLVLDNEEVEYTEIMKYLPGPDFPTGGIICGTIGIRQAYKNGRGKVVVRGKAEFEKNKIIITEIPYMVNKSRLVENIADLVREKRIEGISGLRDESDRHGMRVVVELKLSAQEDVVLNQLYKHTALQSTFGIINLALVDGQPRVLNVKELIFEFIKHRKNVIVKKTEYDLRKAREKVHLLEGILIALNNLDAVIKTIKGSANAKDAKLALVENYKLSELQAQAILDIKLQRLTSMEQDKIRTEHGSLLEFIKECESILASDERVKTILRDEMVYLKSTYGDGRRTSIAEVDLEIETEDLIEEEDVAVTVTNSGYVKRISLDTYKAQKRGGKGIKAAATKDEDFVENIYVTSTHNYLLCFSNLGKIYWLKAFNIPEAGRYAKGTAIVNLLRLDKNEKIKSIIPVDKFGGDRNLMFVTRKGITKKTALSEYSKPRSGGIIAVNLREDDDLVNVLITNGDQEILIATEDGRAVRFKETDVPTVGRNSIGVKGIKVKQSNVVDAIVCDLPYVLTVTEKGYGKRSAVEDYRLINRGGSGVINIKITEKNGKVVGVKCVSDEDVMLITQNGLMVRTSVSQISVISRNTQGVRIIRLGEGDRLINLAKVVSEEE